ncbi:MAG: tetratricopeptide repeat protein [Flavisolibacter sp.]|jgi:Ca-activated chloride channel family protein|nr:tetratricopeptide repeat protein [Flavisolibacter sp.]
MKTVLIILLFLSTAAHAQNAATYISRGNEYYLQLQFELAESQYRLALDKQPNNAEAGYNLANALMQQKKYKAAIEMYEDVTGSDNLNLRAAAFYNAGVSYSKQKDLPNSIEAYKSALRINPNDKEARENLQKALSELKQQQQQENKQNKGGGGMDQKQADQKLKELQQKEKELQQKMQQGQAKGQGGGKDW